MSDNAMAKTGSVVVINPNSNTAVTDGLCAALEQAYPRAQGPLACATLTSGPPAIESPEDIRFVVPRLLAWAEALVAVPNAVVVACFSDPGVAELRVRFPHMRVLGIGEASLTAAAVLAPRVGVISILSGTSERHWAYYTRWGVRDRVVGDRPLELGVAALQDAEATWSRLHQVGAALRDDDGAGAIVLGCAGLSKFREALERELGVPVVDPTLAAVKQVLKEPIYAGFG